MSSSSNSYQLTSFSEERDVLVGYVPPVKLDAAFSMWNPKKSWSLILQVFPF